MERVIWRDPGRSGRPVETLVGRASELSILVGVAAAPPAVAVIEGEAGIGKTRLVSELRADAAMGGRRFLVGACQPVREPFPLGPVIEAVGGLADALAEAGLSPVAGALRPLLPELASRLPPDPPALEDRASERHRVFRGLAELLGAVGPAVLVLEDLHWADELTLDLVGYLLGSPPRGLSLVLTYRGEEVPPGLPAMMSRRLPASQCRLVLSPLDAAQTGALAASILGLERVSDSFAAYLRERSSGLPFVIEELLALMQAKGMLMGRQGAWTRLAIEELDVPAGVRDPVLERLSRLEEPARVVVEAAAILRVPQPPPVVVATSGLPAPGAGRGLDVALAAGLLVERDGVVGFRHSLAADAVYESVPAGRRQQLHSRAADALAGLHSRPLARYARHLRHAGRLPEWVQAAEQAADLAMEQRDYGEAVRLLEDVLGTAPLDDAQRDRLAVKLGIASHQDMHIRDGAVEVLSTVLEADPRPTIRGELRLYLGLLLEKSGADFDVQRRVFAEAVPDLGHRPDLLAQAMLVLAFPAVPGADMAEHRRWLRRVLETLPTVDDPAVRAGLLGKVAMVQVAMGDRGWRELADQVVELAGRSAQNWFAAAAHHSIGVNASFAGHHALAENLLAVALERAVASENHRREVWIRSSQCLLEYLRGQWTGLRERVVRLVDQPGDLMYQMDGEVALGCLAAAQGDTERVAARLEQIVRGVRRRGGFDLLPIPAQAWVRLAIAQRNPVRARERAAWMVATLESVPFQVSAMRALPAIVEATASGGNLDEAGAVVARWRGWVGDLDAPMAAACLAHAEGFMAVARDEWQAAARWFRVAADTYQEPGCPYEEAQARELAGSAMLRAGDQRSGSDQLRAALLAFRRLGAAWDLDRASGLARRFGVPVPGRRGRGPRGYGDDLSPRERQVAELAARGLTNQQIAAELFTSVSTARKHLAAAVRKLEVPSRAALARRWIDYSTCKDGYAK